MMSIYTLDSTLRQQQVFTDHINRRMFLTNAQFILCLGLHRYQMTPTMAFLAIFA